MPNIKKTPTPHSETDPKELERKINEMLQALHPVPADREHSNWITPILAVQNRTEAYKEGYDEADTHNDADVEAAYRRFVERRYDALGVAIIPQVDADDFLYGWHDRKLSIIGTQIYLISRTLPSWGQTDKFIRSFVRFLQEWRKTAKLP